METARMNLIPNAGDWWKLWSIRFIAIATALAAGTATIPELPASIQALLPHWFQQGLASLTVVSGIFAGIARVIKQTNVGNGSQ
jgi:hypothetical protein